MADPFDMLIGAGIGGPVIGGLVWAVKALGHRSVSALDKALEHLEKSIREQGGETKQLIGELTREMRALRDTDIRQAEQIGALQQSVKSLGDRIDGQGNHYRAQYDRVLERVNELGRSK